MMLIFGDKLWAISLLVLMAAELSLAAILIKKWCTEAQRKIILGLMWCILAASVFKSITLISYIAKVMG